MKTFIFSIALMAFSLSANAQCDNQSTHVSSSCGGSYCVSVTIRLTGSLQVDNALYNSSEGTFRRKPNLNELVAFINAAEDEC